jgi:hypothetical protein
MLLGLVILEKLYPTDKFTLMDAVSLENDVYPAILDKTKNITYIVDASEQPEDTDMILYDEQNLQYITWGDAYANLGSMISSNPRVSKQLLEQAFAPNSDFVSLLAGENPNVIGAIYELKRQKVIDFLIPIVVGQLEA